MWGIIHIYATKYFQQSISSAAAEPALTTDEDNGLRITKGIIIVPSKQREVVNSISLVLHCVCTRGNRRYSTCIDLFESLKECGIYYTL